MDIVNGLFLFQSKLGWVCGGKVTTKTEVVNESTLFVSTVGAAPMASFKWGGGALTPLENSCPP